MQAARGLKGGELRVSWQRIANPQDSPTLLEPVVTVIVDGGADAIVGTAPAGATSVLFDSVPRGRDLAIAAALTRQGHLISEVCRIRIRSTQTRTGDRTPSRVSSQTRTGDRTPSRVSSPAPVSATVPTTTTVPQVAFSTSAPAFSTSWHEITGLILPSPTFTGTTWDLTFTTREVAGSLYYVGYNENFANYRSDDPRLTTRPSPARLRIGLANTELDADGKRYASDEGHYDEVDFKAYVIRIEDADGDVVNGGNNVTTVASSYTDPTPRPADGHNFNHDNDGNSGTPFVYIRTPAALVLYGVQTDPTFETGDTPEARTIGTGPNAYALSNVRIMDGSAITVAAQFNSAITSLRSGDISAKPSYISMVKVDAFPFTASNYNHGAATYVMGGNRHPVNKVFAEPPNEHRDFPIDTLASDATYTISAWAINDDDEVISPVVKLKVRPTDTDRGAIPNEGFRDYLTATIQPTALTGLTTTEFTVIK